jgi:hypothetical protein
LCAALHLLCEWPMHLADGVPMTPRHVYQIRPSADRLGNAYWRHGPLRPMEPEKRGIIARIMGRV